MSQQYTYGNEFFKKSYYQRHTKYKCTYLSTSLLIETIQLASFYIRANRTDYTSCLNRVTALTVQPCGNMSSNIYAYVLGFILWS